MGRNIDPGFPDDKSILKFHEGQKTDFSSSTFLWDRVFQNETGRGGFFGLCHSASMDEVRGIHINPGQAVDLMPLLGIKLL